MDRRRHSTRRVTIRGEITAARAEDHGLIFAGLFPDWIPQGTPVRCAVLHGPGPFELQDVPQGTWHLLAQSVTAGHEEIIDGQSPYIGRYGPITILPGALPMSVNLQLRPMRDLDPPVLLALLDSRRRALSATAS
jgi:hypothetical protein